MSAIDNFTLSNASASSAPFSLLGGLYGVTVSGTFSSGSVTLEKLGADNTTYVTALTAFSANGYASVYLPAGTYKFVVASASAVYANACGIPL